ncbi:unannotated protein [freshwater metagenome]|uniref:Unannotated protein n=1 Tax=freshwater metagenome TaxID=449393 RepID=A0A6J6WLB0_9ZZZZ
MAHGCIERCRGRPSRRSAKAIVIAVSGAEMLSERSSGKFSSVFEILRARTCGMDLANISISMPGKPSAAPASRIACRARYVSTIATVAHRD